MLISLSDGRTRIGTLCIGIILMKVDIDKVKNYLEALATHTVTPICSLLIQNRY